MQCLIDLVGVGTECEDAKTYSLKDVDITDTFLNKIVGDEYDTGLELGNAKIAFAAKTLAHQAANYFAKNSYTTSVIEENTIGKRNEGQVVSGFNKSGIRLKLLNDTAHVKTEVVSVQLQLDYTGNITVECYDLHDGSLIGTKTVAVTAGTIATANVEFSKSASKRNTDIAIVYNSSGIDSYKYTVKYGCNSCSAFTRVGQYTEATAVNFDGDVLRENATGVSHTSGLSIIYNLSCDYSAFLCSIKDRLAIPLMHKAAADIYFYQITNNRFNDRSDDERERVIEKMTEHTEQYEMGMKLTLKNIITPNNICFGCSGKFGLNNVLPG